MNFRTPVIIGATIFGTICIAYLYVTYTTNESFSSSSLCTDEKRFYNSLSPRNKRLRPNTRTYYNIDDTRVPIRIRTKIQTEFTRALRDFPLTFHEPKPILQFASGDTEGGMPHTLGNRIIMPLTQGLSMYSNKELWTTMIHELCHLHQRQHPAGWKQLYTKLGFIQLNTSPYHLENDDVVSNPDAGSNGMPQIGWWSYKGQVGVLSFTSNPDTLRDHKTVVYPVTSSGISGGVNYLREDFGDIASQYDHPNEITACIISDCWDDVMRPNTQLSPTDPKMIIRQWILQSNLSKL